MVFDSGLNFKERVFFLRKKEILVIETYPLSPSFLTPHIKINLCLRVIIAITLNLTILR